MRHRWLGAAAGIGLLMVATSVAPSQEPARPMNDPAELRARIARLRAEVEVLQMDHDVDAKILQALIKDMRTFDAVDGSRGQIEKEAESLKQANGGILERPTLSSLSGIPALVEGTDPAEKHRATIDEVYARIARPSYDRLRQQFVARSAELNAKRLELDQLEVESTGHP